MPALAWVLGRGGLLGSRIEQLLPEELPGVTAWIPELPRFSWDDPDRLSHQVTASASSFGQAVRERGAAWVVLWCAAAGGVGTTPEALRAETDALGHLLAALAAAQRGAAGRKGVLLLCSSAGGVYGNSRALPLTEDSPGAPISEYGRNKLRQEEQVRRWADETPGVSCLVARISNLYGPGQSLTRAQGLIGRLSQSVVYRRPLNIYVPLDTLRDYLYAEDAARYALRCLRRLLEAERTSSLVKIFASETSISIAGLIAIFARITKRPPRIVCMPQSGTGQQPGRLRFRSSVWTDLAPGMLDLAAGVHAVYQDHLSLFQRGRLPAPPAG